MASSQRGSPASAVLQGYMTVFTVMSCDELIGVYSTAKKANTDGVAAAKERFAVGGYIEEMVVDSCEVIRHWRFEV